LVEETGDVADEGVVAVDAEVQVEGMTMKKVGFQ